MGFCVVTEVVTFSWKLCVSWPYGFRNVVARIVVRAIYWICIAEFLLMIELVMKWYTLVVSLIKVRGGVIS